MDKGWAPVLRRIKSSSWYPNPDYVAVITHLCLSVRHEAMVTYFAGERITLMPGQLLTTRKLLSLQTGVSEANTERALTRLESEHLISQQTSNKSRLITVLYGPAFVFTEQQKERHLNNRTEISEQQPPIYNKILRKKEIYKKDDPDFQDFWRAYSFGFDQAGALKAYAALRKEGIEHSTLMRAVENYNAFLKYKHTVERFSQGKMYARNFLSEGRWQDYLDMATPHEPGSRNLRAEEEKERERALYKMAYDAWLKDFMKEKGYKTEDEIPFVEYVGLDDFIKAQKRKGR